MIEPIPHAEEADIAEQARSVDDDEQRDALPDLLGDNWDTDIADPSDQKLSVSGHDDDHPATSHSGAAPVTGGVFWPAWESNSLSTQRSFTDDMASQNQPHRPNW